MTLAYGMIFTIADDDRIEIHKHREFEESDIYNVFHPDNGGLMSIHSCPARTTRLFVGLEQGGSGQSPAAVKSRFCA